MWELLEAAKKWAIRWVWEQRLARLEFLQESCFEEVFGLGWMCHKLP